MHASLQVGLPDISLVFYVWLIDQQLTAFNQNSMYLGVLEVPLEAEI